MPAPMVVRMFNEYGCPWPFFGPDSVMSQAEFPLPPELTQRVLAWTADFEDQYDHELGWASTAARDASHAAGRRLAEKVQAAVGESIIIKFEHWEHLVNGAEPE